MANLTTPICPLGDEHCAILNQVLQGCSDLACYLERLKAIGLDVSEWEARNDATRALATGLKQAHFPEHH